MDRTSIKNRFGIIGDDAKLNTAIDIAMQVAPTEVTVLITGENGSGKDVFSRILHQQSARKHKSFIAINCGAIPEGTIDSELFGHEKGSFTSAFDSRKGYFEEANGGMIFLDEIAEMPMPTQARLLRVLENGEYLRVGSSKVQKTDVRIVAATNKNLIEAIRQGKFREDLYFRLNTVTIQVPALRDRGDDIELLFRFFANEFAQQYGRKPIKLGESAKPFLHDYHWPGNVRELRNFVEKLTVLVQHEQLSAEDMNQHLPSSGKQLPILLTHGPRLEYDTEPEEDYQTPTNGNAQNELLFKVLYDLKSEMADMKRMLYAMLQNQFGQQPQQPAGNLPMVIQRGPAPPQPYYYDDQPEIGPRVLEEQEEENLSLEQKERDLIEKALEKHNHNRKKAATELGISERTLYRKIKSYDLDKK